MSSKVYVLLDIENSQSEQAIRTLRGMPGVVIADALEERPDVIMLIEASEREKLAELTVGALQSVESVTEEVQLLPVQDKSNTNA